MGSRELNQVLATITPERVRGIILALSSKQSPQLRSLVALESIANDLIGNADLGQGQERGQAYERVKLAIRDAVGQIPGMRYVHGST